jgi:phenylalanyl-tRNA synthetase beta chain
LHVYDYDKVKAKDPGAKHASINVRMSKKGERLTLLGGKTVELKENTVTIATATQAIGIAGVMGGADTEVDENTKNIILECGTFDMNITRRTSMAYGLFTDAATRFTKGQSPLQNRAVIAKMANDVLKFAGGRVCGELIDINHVDTTALKRGSLYAPVTVTPEFINIVEEVGRLYGYDKLPVILPNRDLSPAKIEPMLGFKSTLRNILTRAGSNEVLTYSFVHANLLEKAGQDKSLAFKVSNAISPDLHYYRLSLMPSLLEKVHPNIKAGFKQFSLFEINKTHNKKHYEEDEPGVPKEFQELALVFAATEKNSEIGGAAYYQARKTLDFIAYELAIEIGGVLPKL